MPLGRPLPLPGCPRRGVTPLGLAGVAVWLAGLRLAGINSLGLAGVAVWLAGLRLAGINPLGLARLRLAGIGLPRLAIGRGKGRALVDLLGRVGAYRGGGPWGHRGRVTGRG
ncbi:MAG: hypothetical protein LBF58_07130 [Deltaproteobacteria bacterium]|nr:hypothetical protein [Deltaproteobacteria bacterium]